MLGARGDGTCSLALVYIAGPTKFGRFLEPGRWPLALLRADVPSPNADAVHVYTDTSSASRPTDRHITTVNRRRMPASDVTQTARGGHGAANEPIAR